MNRDDFSGFSDPFSDIPVAPKPGRRFPARWLVIAASLLAAATVVFFMVWRPAVLTVFRGGIELREQQDGTFAYAITDAQMRKPSVCGFLLFRQQTSLGMSFAPFTQSPDGTWVFVGAPPASDFPGDMAVPFALVDDTMYLGSIQLVESGTVLPQISAVAATPTPNPPTSSPALTASETRIPTLAPPPTQTPSATAAVSPEPTAKTVTAVTPQTAEPSPTPAATVPPATPTPSPTPTAAGTEPAPANSTFHLFGLETRYYYHQLSVKEKAVFAAVYDGIMDFKDTIRFSPDCTERELDRVMFVIYNDCPELMQLSASYIKHYQDANAYFSVSPQYDMDEAQYQTALQQSIAAVDQLQYAADFGTTDLTRELSIYRNLLTRTSYSTTALFCDRAYGPLLEGQGKCDGYAKALALALRYYGIPSTILCGDSFQLDTPQDSEEHCWNYVFIGQRWYQCDPTWDDTDDDLLSLQADYLPFFNLTDERMLLSRTLHSSFTEWALPVCDSTEAYYYTNHGVFLKQGKSFTDALDLSLTQAYQSHADYAAIAFESRNDYTDAMSAVQTEMTDWRYQGVRIQAYTYTYTNEGLVLYLYGLAFYP